MNVKNTHVVSRDPSTCGADIGIDIIDDEHYPFRWTCAVIVPGLLGSRWCGESGFASSQLEADLDGAYHISTNHM